MADAESDVETEVFFRSPPLASHESTTRIEEGYDRRHERDRLQSRNGEGVTVEWHESREEHIGENEQRIDQNDEQEEIHWQEPEARDPTGGMKGAMDRMVHMQTQMAEVLQNVAQVLESMNKKTREQSQEEVGLQPTLNHNKNCERLYQVGNRNHRGDGIYFYDVPEQVQSHSDERQNYEEQSYRHLTAHRHITQENYERPCIQSPITRDRHPYQCYERPTPTRGYRDQLHPSQENYERLPQRKGRNNVSFKIPAFQGRDDWKVWINRFEAVADRQAWSDEDKLDQLLPHLQGNAAEFVFTQLRKETLQDYKKLVSEIDHRFRVVETSKTFAAKFSRREQRNNETAEEYAAELKCLYDKAHPARDPQTRKEDLVRRFLDGLRDDDVRCEVEYVKEPSDIDEAVYHVVSFIQTRRRPAYGPYADKKMRKALRGASLMPFDEEEEEDERNDCGEADRVCRVPMQVKQHKAENEKETSPSALAQSEHTDSDNKSLLIQLLDKITELTQEKQIQKDIKERQDRQKRGRCFTCSQIGHYSRDCPLKENSSNMHQSRSADGNRRGNISRFNQRGFAENNTDNFRHLNENGPALMAERRSKMM